MSKACGAAVAELAQATAHPCGRVQAVQGGPPVLGCTHLPGAEGSTAAAAVITRPPRGLCCPVHRPPVPLAGQCTFAVIAVWEQTLRANRMTLGLDTPYSAVKRPPPPFTHHLPPALLGAYRHLEPTPSALSLPSGMKTWHHHCTLLH